LHSVQIRLSLQFALFSCSTLAQLPLFRELLNYQIFRWYNKFYSNLNTFAQKGDLRESLPKVVAELDPEVTIIGHNVSNPTIFNQADLNNYSKILGENNYG